MKKYAIILAAGNGTRMNISIPKGAIDFFGKTIIERIVEQCEKNNFDEIIVVVGYKKEIIMNILGDRVTYVIQEKQIGTANAVMSCYDYFRDKEGICVILPSDIPLIDDRTLYKFMKVHYMTNSSLTILSTFVKEENQYGRIYRKEGFLKRIIEYKDATIEERKIEEVNSGIYCVDTKLLFKELSNITNINKTNEFYITDLLEIFEKKYKVNCYLLMDNTILMGVNSQEELQNAKNIFKEKSNNG